MAALGAGAHGFIPKTADASCCSTPCSACSTAACPRRPTARPCPTATASTCAPDALGLTARQTDVLKLLVQGKPNKLICRDLTSRRERSRSM